jgi:hypothetical protein
MLRILIADGTPAAMQAERETFGIPSNASLFEAALRPQQPLKISHVNPGPNPASDANAAAISIDLQAGKAGGTASQGIFLKSTGGTSGEIMHYVDSAGVMIFALLPDGSLLLRPLAAPPAGTKAGLKLCNVSGTLGVVDSTGTFTPLT